MKGNEIKQKNDGNNLIGKFAKCILVYVCLLISHKHNIRQCSGMYCEFILFQYYCINKLTITYNSVISKKSSKRFQLIIHFLIQSKSKKFE